jgi:hypothetical protein
VQVAACLNEVSQLRSSLENLFEVIEHKQHLALGDVFVDSIVCSESACNRVEHKRRITDHRQGHPENARLELGNKLCGGLQREPSLARTPGSREGGKPGALGDERGDLGDLPFSTDE